jgi:hypothetical protein
MGLLYLFTLFLCELEVNFPTQVDTVIPTKAYIPLPFIAATLIRNYDNFLVSIKKDKARGINSDLVRLFIQ